MFQNQYHLHHIIIVGNASSYLMRQEPADGVVGVMRMLAHNPSPPPAHLNHSHFSCSKGHLFLLFYFISSFTFSLAFSASCVSSSPSRTRLTVGQIFHMTSEVTLHTVFPFLSDPGIPGVRSMGPSVSK